MKTLMIMLSLIGIGFSGGYLLHAELIKQHLQQIRQQSDIPLLREHLLAVAKKDKQKSHLVADLVKKHLQYIEEEYKYYQFNKRKSLAKLHDHLVAHLAPTQLQEMESFLDDHGIFEHFQEDNIAIVLSKMGLTVDQFNRSFQQDENTENLTIIYIPGSNDPFAKIYDKHKGKKIKGNIQFIGGFKEMMKGWDPKTKKGHLQDAFQSRYGKQHFPILLDLESEIGDLLSIRGYTILQISIKDKKLVSKKEYDFNRITFFKELNQYFIQ